MSKDDCIIRPMHEGELEALIEQHDVLNPKRPMRGDTKESIDLYVSQGVPPGGFLSACLENDLMGAMNRADSYNRASLFEIVSYIHNDIPSNCHGSPEHVASWINSFKEPKDE